MLALLSRTLNRQVVEWAVDFSNQIRVEQSEFDRATQSEALTNYEHAVTVRKSEV